RTKNRPWQSALGGSLHGAGGNRTRVREWILQRVYVRVPLFIVSSGRRLADGLFRTSPVDSHPCATARHTRTSPICRCLRAHLGPGRSGDRCVRFSYAVSARLSLAVVNCCRGLTR